MKLLFEWSYLLTRKCEQGVKCVFSQMGFLSGELSSLKICELVLILSFWSAKRRGSAGELATPLTQGLEFPLTSLSLSLALALPLTIALSLSLNALERALLGRATLGRNTNCLIDFPLFHYQIHVTTDSMFFRLDTFVTICSHTRYLDIVGRLWALFIL